MQPIESFEVPAPPKVNYINATYGLKSWLLTKDHKRIALLYLGSITFFFFIGGLYALMIRLELLTPQGDLLQSTTYNKVFTQHGIIMIFFFLIPSIPATLGNFLIPMMIGAKDLAFPRINLLSWYIFLAPVERAAQGQRRTTSDCRHGSRRHHPLLLRRAHHHARRRDHRSQAPLRRGPLAS
jgi:hypothetical protein